VSDQTKLFHAGSGVRDRSGVVAVVGKIVVLRIDGVKLTSPNGIRGMSKGASYSHMARIRKLRERIKLEVSAAFGADDPVPTRVVITRRSFGELDRDNAWSSAKPVWDGIADAFGLPNDRALQNAGDVRQEKCKRGTFGIVLEFSFA
jgi:hypothetical protein